MAVSNLTATSLLVRLLLVALMCLSTMVFGQSTKKMSTYINSGLSLPTGPEDLAENWQAGFLFGGGVGYNLSNNAELMASFLIGRHPLDKEAFGFSNPDNVVGGTTSLLTLFGNLKLNLRSQAAARTYPYVLFGAGLFSVATDDIMLNRGGRIRREGDNAPGLGGGLGMTFGVGKKLNLFIEGNYSYGFTEVSSSSMLMLKLGLHAN